MNLLQLPYEVLMMDGVNIDVVVVQLVEPEVVILDVADSNSAGHPNIGEQRQWQQTGLEIRAIGNGEGSTPLLSANSRIQLSWQSNRPISGRSLVRAQVFAPKQQVLSITAIMLGSKPSDEGSIPSGPAKFASIVQRILCLASTQKMGVRFSLDAPNYSVQLSLVERSIWDGEVECSSHSMETKLSV